MFIFNFRLFFSIVSSCLCSLCAFLFCYINPTNPFSFYSINANQSSAAAKVVNEDYKGNESPSLQDVIRPTGLLVILYTAHNYYCTYQKQCTQEAVKISSCRAVSLKYSSLHVY